MGDNYANISQRGWARLKALAKAWKDIPLLPSDEFFSFTLVHSKIDGVDKAFGKQHQSFKCRGNFNKKGLREKIVKDKVEQCNSNSVFRQGHTDISDTDLYDSPAMNTERFSNTDHHNSPTINTKQSSDADLYNSTNTEHSYDVDLNKSLAIYTSLDANHSMSIGNKEPFKEDHDIIQTFSIFLKREVKDKV